MDGGREALEEGEDLGLFLEDGGEGDRGRGEFGEEGVEEAEGVGEGQEGCVEGGGFGEQSALVEKWVNWVGEG